MTLPDDYAVWSFLSFHFILCLGASNSVILFFLDAIVVAALSLSLETMDMSVPIRCGFLSCSQRTK